MASEFTAVLFSGGKGSRLFPLNEFHQKVMMPIGKFGMPLLEVVIRHLKHYGITKFVCLIGYKGNQIRRYFNSGDWLGVDIQYSFDSPKYGGTGGALYNAREMIKTDYFITYYTDILTSMNFEQFTQFHVDSGKIGTLWIDPDWDESVNSVNYNSDYFATEIGSSHEKLLVGTGIAAFSKSVFDIMDKKIVQNNQLDISTDVLPDLVSSKQLMGYVSSDWWLDVGSIVRHSTIDESLLVRQLNHLREGGLF